MARGRCGCINSRGRIPTRELDRRIILKKRTLQVPTGGGVDFDLDFTVLATVAAKIQTVKGTMFFNGTNLGITSSHKITLLFRSDITSGDTWIEYRDENYLIFDVDNVNETNEVMILRATKRGEKTVPVNTL